ncbi:ribbon-helix-helix domain-containing protein [Corynebacterium glaucum]|uniref:ribbon-helix-helix domain-containing protein n=1 Tax=Corynebacterium glaucum TaxID=187491 RepID=UPI002658FF26|nr:ribbon-helix-helix domain-containing protein [Corynebacterium glaucum]
MNTINDQPVNEDDSSMLNSRGRKPRDEDAAKVVSIRLSPSELADLDRYAAAHGWTRSRAIREALMNTI